MNERQLTWNAAEEYCSNLNLTMMVPDTRLKTINIGLSIYGWTPQEWQDAPANSFETYWLGYREIGDEWVNKLK